MNSSQFLNFSKGIQDYLQPKYVDIDQITKYIADQLYDKNNIFLYSCILFSLDVLITDYIEIKNKYLNFFHDVIRGSLILYVGIYALNMLLNL